MISGSIGRRYAKAFLEIARDNKRVEESLEELERFGQALEGESDLKFLMTDPLFAVSERKKTLSAIAGSLKLSSDTQNFVKLLIDRDRMAYFTGILLAFREQADDVLGRVRVKVEMEEPIGEALQEQLKKILEQITKKKVILDFSSQKGILGGVIIKMKDWVFDGSVKSALQKMKERMMEAGVQ